MSLMRMQALLYYLHKTRGQRMDYKKERVQELR